MILLLVFIIRFIINIVPIAVNIIISIFFDQPPLLLRALIVCTTEVLLALIMRVMMVMTMMMVMMMTMMITKMMIMMMTEVRETWCEEESLGCATLALFEDIGTS